MDTSQLAAARSSVPLPEDVGRLHGPGSHMAIPGHGPRFLQIVVKPSSGLDRSETEVCPTSLTLGSVDLDWSPRLNSFSILLVITCLPAMLSSRLLLRSSRVLSRSRASSLRAPAQLTRSSQLTSSKTVHTTRPSRATTTLTMPALSPTMSEGSVTDWKVAEGEAFVAGQVLLQIETDKASIEVEAQDDGVMGKILVSSCAIVGRMWTPESAGGAGGQSGWGSWGWGTDCFAHCGPIADSPTCSPARCLTTRAASK